MERGRRRQESKKGSNPGVYRIGRRRVENRKRGGGEWRRECKREEKSGGEGRGRVEERGGEGGEGGGE